MIMLKKLFLLFLLILSYFSGIAQVVPVDSIDVSIVVPDSYRNKGFRQPDSLLKETDSLAVLDFFYRIDSMFPEEDLIFSTSGELAVKTKNYYTPLARPLLQHLVAMKILANKRIEEENPFNPYLVSLHWPSPREYKPFAFSLKYRTPDYGRIDNFEPSLSSRKERTYTDFLEHPLRADTLIASRDEPPIQESMERLLIEKPLLVEQIWDSIPEPPEFSSDEERIMRRSVFESMGRLKNWEQPDTQKELAKKKELKRPWKYGGTENVQLSQGFVENWAKGGENSVSLLSDLRLHANYSKENVEWESYGVHKLGILHTEDKKMRVNDDLLELNSKYGLNASDKWFYSGLLNFKTQIFNGYEKNDLEKEDPISGFLAPAYMTMALGMDYKEKNFTLMLLPFSSKMTAVIDTAKYDQTRYKIDEERKIDYMGGASLVNNFSWKISKDFNLASRMDIFYEYMKSGEENEIQGEWELILDMNISVFMSTRISTYLRYYSNESKKLQLKENLSISFNYRF